MHHIYSHDYQSVDYRVKYYAGTLSKTHDKAGQHNAELKDRFVDNTE